MQDGEIDRMNRSVADMRAKLKYNCYVEAYLRGQNFIIDLMYRQNRSLKCMASVYGVARQTEAH